MSDNEGVDRLGELLLSITREPRFYERYENSVRPAFELGSRGELLFWPVSGEIALKRSLLNSMFYVGDSVLLPSGHGLPGVPFEVSLRAVVGKRDDGLDQLDFDIECLSNSLLVQDTRTYRRFVAYVLGVLTGSLLFGCVEEKVDKRMGKPFVCHSCPLRRECRADMTPFFFAGFINGYSRALAHRTREMKDPSFLSTVQDDFGFVLHILGEFAKFASHLLYSDKESLEVHLEKILNEK